MERGARKHKTTIARAQTAPDVTSDRSHIATQSLVRGLAVIRAFSGRHSSLKVSEVATLAGITRATARRILLTLIDVGYVVEENQRFRLSPNVLDLGYSYLSSLELSDILEPAIARLVTRVDLPCSAAVLDGEDIVIVHILHGLTRRLLRFDTHVGTRLPAYPGAMGRVLLASLTEAAFETYLERVRLERLTPYTVRTKRALLAAVAQVRAVGWSVSDRERDAAVISIAVPLAGRAGRTIAALNVSIHSTTISAKEMVREFLPPLRVAQAEINEALRARD